MILSFACLAAMSLCQTTRAQTYVPNSYKGPQYEGGSATYDGSSTPVPYAQLSPPGGLDYGFNGSGANNCIGQITTTFIWSSPVPAPPPQTVIVAETANAYWMDFGGTGACDDGLGDPAVPSDAPPQPNDPITQNSATSSGTHYFVGTSTGSGPVTVSGGTVTVECTPTASTPAGGPECIVGYSAYVYPVTIQLSGTTSVNSSQQALSGQQITATLNYSGTGTIISWTWSFTGGSGINPFKDWDPNAPGDGNPTQLIPLAPSDLSGTYNPASSTPPPAPGISFYDDTNDTITVDCTVTIQPPQLPNGTMPPAINLSVQSMPVKFLEPTATWDINTWAAHPAEFVDNSATSGSFGQKVFWYPVTISDPGSFTGGSGCFVQTLDDDRSNTRIPIGNYQAVWNQLEMINPDGSITYGNPAIGLDGAFPYSVVNILSSPSDTTGTPETSGFTWSIDELISSGDYPTQVETPNYYYDRGGTIWISASATDIYTTSLMYRPPVALGGTGDTIWVPLQQYTWSWDGTGTLDTAVYPSKWSATGSTPVPAGGIVNHTYPAWTDTAPAPLTYP